jgi:glycerate kinase
MGAALMAFLGAELKSGIEIVTRRSILKNIFTTAPGC